MQEQYEWGHIQKDKYLNKHVEIKRELDRLTPPETESDKLDRLASLLKSVPDMWIEANQEQRNKLACALFDDVIVEHNRVVAVKPKAELIPFFKLSYEDHQLTYGKYQKRPRWDSNPRSSA